MLCVFDQPAAVNCVGSESIDSCAVITPVFEELNALTEELLQAEAIVLLVHLRLLLFGDGVLHNHADYPAAFHLLLLGERGEAEEGSSGEKFFHHLNYQRQTYINYSSNKIILIVAASVRAVYYQYFDILLWSGGIYSWINWVTDVIDLYNINDRAIHATSNSKSTMKIPSARIPAAIPTNLPSQPNTLQIIIAPSPKTPFICAFANAFLSVGLCINVILNRIQFDKIITSVMEYSGPGDLKTDSKRHVEKIEVSFEDNIFQGRKFKLKFFPWIRTSELKKILVKEKFNDKHTHLTEHDIRLFFKNIELSQENKNFFDFYKIESGSTVVIMKNANAHNLENGVINPYQIFEKVPEPITNLVLNVQTGLNAGKRPKLASEGTSGTYFLENNQKKVVAVYKPFDEEPYTPNNPRGYVGEIGSEGIRKGILSGECATREVAAYLLDSVKHYHQVPATAYVEFYHPCFSYKEFCESNPIVSHTQCDLKKLRTKHGSLQQFVEYMDIVGNLGARQFDMNEVHKIAILDLRILNCDRNEANILVVKKLVNNSKGSSSKITNLIPIDHGLSFPDNFEIYEHQIVWMGYKQTEMPLSKQSLQYIESIDPIQDCKTLREKLGFREICLRNFRIAQTFLKKMAKAGFTLHEIGKFLYREDESDWSSEQEVEKQVKKPLFSELERLVKEAEVIYYTVRDNGIKSTVEFQIGLIKHRKNEEIAEYQDSKQINSQEENLQLGSLLKKSSKVKETSIQKIDQSRKSKHKVRNISLPNLKKKPSNLRDKRMRMKKRKTKDTRGGEVKDKNEKWGEVFFHYFQEILERFIKRKLEVKNKPLPKPARGRLFSENIEL